MNDLTRTHCEHLLYVLRAPPQLLQDILICPSFLLVTTVCELALNLLYGDLQLTDEDKDVLRRHKELLEQLADSGVEFRPKVILVRYVETELLGKFREILERYV
jgi:hypothetical protein